MTIFSYQKVLNTIGKTGTDPAYKSNHSTHWVTLKLNEIEHGRGFWKFNNSLRNDSSCVDKIKEIIQNTKRENENGYDDHGKPQYIADDNGSSKQSLWSEYTIKYSSEQKKEMGKRGEGPNKTNIWSDH